MGRCDTPDNGCHSTSENATGASRIASIATRYEEGAVVSFVGARLSVGVGAETQQAQVEVQSSLASSEASEQQHACVVATGTGAHPPRQASQTARICELIKSRMATITFAMFREVYRLYSNRTLYAPRLFGFGTEWLYFTNPPVPPYGLPDPIPGLPGTSPLP